MARTQQVLVSKAVMTRSWWSRLRGLLGRRALDEEEGLVLPRCRSIHTLGMRFPIDAVFVDRTWRVVAVRTRLRPGRLVWPIWSAWGVVELASGRVERVGIRVGDRLVLEPA